MFNLRLAEHVFRVHNRFPFTERLCADYRTDKPFEAEIFVSAEDVVRENISQDENGGGRFADDYLESLAVYRKICELLLDRDILLFHASALAVGGRAYLFAAPSGTGKSTHTRLWRERYGERVVMINDDKPLLKVTDKNVTVYGSPYGGKDGIHTNTSAEVGGIVLLHQSKTNTIEPIGGEEAYPALLNQTYRRTDPDGMAKTLDLVDRLARLPLFRMGCNISPEAAEVAYAALTKAGNV
ncbi:MAG: hypothetical protein NC084_03235 [Bacteroides sp.]|nr:hypothetical protein [Eubacterium sp.]MCM1417579.1 hypothetical protein [Roseburia sp.]MCM1461710.1 hypothetical protein [Bacteroides sp.]